MVDGSSPHRSPTEASPDASQLPFAAELQRKVLHLLALIVPGGIYLLGMPNALYLLGPATALGITGDVLRAYHAGFNRLIRHGFGALMRPRELPPPGGGVVINGATWVLVAATVMVLLFPVRIAVPVFTMFMVSDAVAALVGRRWGRHPWGHSPRTLEGSAAFLGTGLATMATFPALALGPSVVATVAACIAEALPGPGNDNLRVPVVGGLVLALLEAWWLDQPVALFPLLAGG